MLNFALTGRKRFFSFTILNKNYIFFILHPVYDSACFKIDQVVLKSCLFCFIFQIYFESSVPNEY